jgi:type VI secretion system protein ImpC
LPERSSRSSVQLDVAPDEQRSFGPAEPDAPFRILILGDFSGRSNRGLASKLAGRRPVSVDRDNLDEVIAGMGVALGLPGVALQFSELDDFHPDQIYRRAGIFGGLPETQPPTPQGLAGDSLLDQMADQAGDEPVKAAEAAGDLAAFLKRAVAPHLVPRESPELQERRARIQASTGDVMRTILHHPDFQALEAAWRAVFMLVRGLDTDGALKLYVFDATLRELAEDPAGMARLLIEQNEPWAVVTGNYAFGQSEQDAQRLSQFGKMAREAGAPFLAEALPNSGAEDTPHWQSLGHSPEARWIGLTMPRFLLRLPYGKETSPVDSFEFEEMPKSVHQDYLWGNPAFCCALLLGQAFETYGWNLRPGAYRQIDGLPLHVYQEDGEPVMKPCAEVLLTEREAEFLMEQGIMPLASLKNQDAVLLVRFQSIAQPPAALSGRWSS